MEIMKIMEEMEAEKKAEKLLVISDTHGNGALLAEVLAWAAGRGIGGLAFLGDGLADLERALAQCRFTGLVKRVRGNCDSGGLAAPVEETLDFGGRRFLLTHGNTHALAGDLGSLLRRARETGAEAVLYGHTHVPHRETREGVLLLNPGSLGRPRSQAGSTFATVECPPGKILQVRLWTMGPSGLGPVASVFP